MNTDWDDPESRLRLIERVGPAEYYRMHMAHRDSLTIVRVNGHAIRPINTRFGLLFQVGNTGRAFSTLEEARKFARRP